VAVEMRTTELEDETHAGRVLKMLIEATGGDYKAAAAAAKMSPASLSERISGKTAIKEKELRAFAKYFGVKPGVFFVPPIEFFRQSASG